MKIALNLLRQPVPGWRKSSYCASGECLEATRQDDNILLRNTSKPRIITQCTVDEWRAFAAGVRSGEFAHLE